MNRHFRNILVSSTIGLALTILSIGYSLGGSYSASGFSSPGVYNTTSMGYPLHYYTEYTLVYCPYPYSCLGDHTDFSLLDAAVDFLALFVVFCTVVYLVDYGWKGRRRNRRLEDEFGSEQMKLRDRM